MWLLAVAAPVPRGVPTRTLCAVFPPYLLSGEIKWEEKRKRLESSSWSVTVGEMKKGVSLGMLVITAALVIAATTTIHYEILRMEGRSRSLSASAQRFDGELKQQWLSGGESSSASKSGAGGENSTALLAIAVGVSQKQDVDVIVGRFLAEKYSVMLFHYDGNMEGWYDLEWSKRVIHVVAQNQTKWWFAKRFLHPDVVSIYDHIFLWDEDLGVENFQPRRYLQMVISEALQISQPALDPINSPEIHHRITVRRSKRNVHRRVLYDFRGSLMNCSDESTTGPPCSGWVEGMVPVFSRAAWRCVWHLIQNDLIHGWGLDMKFGYCAQGDPTRNVGVIDTEFVVHKGIPSLGGRGSSVNNKLNPRSIDLRTHIRRQSTAELRRFKQRWEQAVSEDPEWNDPFQVSTSTHSIL